MSISNYTASKKKSNIDKKKKGSHGQWAHSVCNIKKSLNRMNKGFLPILGVCLKTSTMFSKAIETQDIIM